MSAALDRTIIRVESLGRTLGWYCDNLQWIEHDRWAVDTLDNAYLGPPDAHDDAVMRERTDNHGDHTYEFCDA